MRAGRIGSAGTARRERLCRRVQGERFLGRNLHRTIDIGTSDTGVHGGAVLTLVANTGTVGRTAVTAS